MSSAAVDRAFAALADPIRRRTVELLRKQPRRAGELAEAQGLTPPAMSRHLRILRTHGVVEEERDAAAIADDARVRVYRLRREPFAALHEWLAEVEAFWSDQLGAFKAHAEGKRGKRGAP